MNLLKDIKAVIFDMDGTLVDSMWVWKDIDKLFLSKRNLTMPNDLQKQIEGMSFHETAVFFKKQFNLPESLEEIEDIWNKMAFYKYANEIKLKGNVYDLLIELKRNNILIGIATSNSRLLAEECLKNLKILELFDTIITSGEITRGKPAPDIYLKAACELNVEPSECLVFEDIPNGITAGKNAGMTTCAVYDDFSKHMDDEKKKLADYYINGYEEITANNFSL